MEVFMKGLGYRVSVLPEIVLIDEKKAEHQAKQKKLFADGMDTVQ